jgi:hypothetical protein
MLNIRTGGSLFGKHFIPFGRSGDMGNAIMTQIIHQQNTLLKKTKQRILKNINYINEVIEMPLSEEISFAMDGAFTIREAFTCYKDKQGGPLFTSIESTQTGGTYCFLFNEKHAVEVDKALLGIDAKLESIGSWDESNVHYRYITDDEVNVTGIHPKSQGSDFWQNYYKKDVWHYPHRN